MTLIISWLLRLMVLNTLVTTIYYLSAYRNFPDKDSHELARYCLLSMFIGFPFVLLLAIGWILILVVNYTLFYPADFFPDMKHVFYARPRRWIIRQYARLNTPS